MPLLLRGALRKFHGWKIVKTLAIRLRVIKDLKGPNARDQIAFCAFYSFLVEVQMKAGYIHATHA